MPKKKALSVIKEHTSTGTAKKQTSHRVWNRTKIKTQNQPRTKTGNLVYFTGANHFEKPFCTMFRARTESYKRRHSQMRDHTTRTATNGSTTATANWFLPMSAGKWHVRRTDTKPEITWNGYQRRKARSSNQKNINR
jgi:hypothetical protein